MLKLNCYSPEIRRCLDIMRGPYVYCVKHGICSSRILIARTFRPKLLANRRHKFETITKRVEREKAFQTINIAAIFHRIIGLFNPRT